MTSGNPLNKNGNRINGKPLKKLGDLTNWLTNDSQLNKIKESINGNPLNKVGGLTSRLMNGNPKKRVGDLTARLNNNELTQRESVGKAKIVKQCSQRELVDTTTWRNKKKIESWKIVDRQETANVGGRNGNYRNNRNEGRESSSTRSRSGRVTSKQNSFNERNNKRVDRTTERDQVKGNTVEGKQANDFNVRDHNDKKNRNNGQESSNARSQSGRGTTSMQTFVNERDNQRVDRTTERGQVETSQTSRWTLTQNTVASKVNMQDRHNEIVENQENNVKQ